MVEIFEHNSYKSYLNERLDAQERGARSLLSQAMTCQTAYTAQVLRGNAHLSMEQAEAVNTFFNHTEEESRFFFLLVQRERASTKNLELRLTRHIKEIRKARTNLKARLGVDPVLKEVNQSIYYSSWIYAAIHALVSIPENNTFEKLKKKINIEPSTLTEALEFLIRCGLLIKNGNQFAIGKSRIHLGAESPFISKHHMNWRIQAVRAIENSPRNGLHYSSVVSLSETDSKAIREKIIRFIKELKATVAKSKEETARCLSFDFYEI